MVAGAHTNASVVHRFKPETLLRWVLPVELMFAATGLVLTYLEWGGLVSLIPGICCLLFANGFVPGNASALALSRHGEAAGAASALIGTLQAGVSAGVMGLLSALGDSQREMTLVQTCALAAALIILVAGGVYRRGHSPRP
jgi:DHA1 family bicyclomycin/chloramphenicol resistance-like MFS transporter